ncbi:MAG: Holliday junction resolvase RuvX [Coriobacteriales bacterium]|nr:Holliday junction resolvase RuvX [Coriobacteriales bacterium]
MPDSEPDSLTEAGVLGLDLGERRCGIAVASRAQPIPIPLKTLKTQEVLAGTGDFWRIVREYDVRLLVAGMPLSLDGAERFQARQARRLAARVSARYGLPLEFVDERLSSVEARNLLRQAGCRERDMRGRTDKIAAALILSTWLGKQAQSRPPVGQYDGAKDPADTQAPTNDDSEDCF